MMEETFLVNVVKEKLCYVSLDFTKDMHQTKCFPSVLRLLGGF